MADSLTRARTLSLATAGLLTMLGGCSRGAAKHDLGVLDLAGSDLAATSHDLSSDLALPLGSGGASVEITPNSQFESAAFLPGSVGPNPFTTCTRSGECMVCVPKGLDMAGALPGVAPDTGAITIANGMTTLATLTPTNGNGSYTYATQTTGLAVAGDVIHFSSVGNTATGDIPALADSTVIVPHAVTVTAPASNSMATVTKANGVTLTWSGGVTGEQIAVSLGAQIFSSGVAHDSVTISCTFDSGAGTGTIPTSAITDQTSGAVSFYSIQTNTSSVPGFTVTNQVYRVPVNDASWTYGITAFN